MLHNYINPHPARNESDYLYRQYTSVQPDQPLYCISHLNIPKIDNGQLQKWKMDYSIQEIQQAKEIMCSLNVVGPCIHFPTVIYCHNCLL